MKAIEKVAPVSDFMQAQLLTVDPEDRMIDAVVTLADCHIYGLPVLDQHGSLVGVLAASDVLEAMSEAQSKFERDQLMENTLVKDVMTPNPATIEQSATMAEAAQQMLYQDIHRLFVTDQGQLAGVISQSDIVRAVGTGKL